MENLQIHKFPHQTFDKLRYGDTDRQGHVNNAVFMTFFETGRVEVLYDPQAPLHDADGAFVIARMTVDYRAEVIWPGQVQIATRVADMGRSSIKLEQVLYQDGRLVASAESVIVHINATSKKSVPLSEFARARLMNFSEA